jgi:hypothetical protein
MGELQTPARVSSVAARGVHRLIFALHNGRFPNKDIDHINHNRSDNRPENLREVDKAENNKNYSKYSNNSSGITGVSKKGKKWQARIQVDKKPIYLGVFNTIEDAASAREEALTSYGFHRNHGI